MFLSVKKTCAVNSPSVQELSGNSGDLWRAVCHLFFGRLNSTQQKFHQWWRNSLAFLNATKNICMFPCQTMHWHI